jgi:hypothetical protein
MFIIIIIIMIMKMAAAAAAVGVVVVGMFMRVKVLLEQTEKYIYIVYVSQYVVFYLYTYKTSRRKLVTFVLQKIVRSLTGSHFRHRNLRFDIKTLH